MLEIGLGEVTGPAAIAQCTGEDGRGMIFGSCGFRGLRPITDGERTEATSRLSVLAWHTFTTVAKMWLTDGGVAECGRTLGSGTVWGLESGTG